MRKIRLQTLYYDNGISLQAVRDYLGHEYEEMTRQYVDYMPKKLQNRVKRAVLLSESPMLDVDGLEVVSRVCGNEEAATPAILPLKGEAFEKESIARALKACNGHREQTAGMLNINPATLYRKMKKYGLK